MPRASSSRVPIELNTRLQARRSELEQTAFARIRAISDAAATPDQAYFDGLRGALAAALDYGLAAIVSPLRDPEPVPVELLSQARLAARNGVSIDAVLRRYAAGHSLLADALLEEAAAAGISAADLQAALRSLAFRFDRVVATVSEEYGREEDTSQQEPEQRSTKLVRRLLAGEPLDASDLGYDLDGHHLGLAAIGAGGADALRKLGEDLDRRLLLVEPDEQIVWAWLGGRREFDERELDFLGAFSWPEQAAFACGETAPGLSGWRLTHRQAAAALPIAQRRPGAVVRYFGVALLATVLQDDLLSTSLRRLYLEPLEQYRDGGEVARRTLRAYFAADRNVSSAAAALGVKRHTVTTRLRTIEERIGHPLNACASEVNAALCLDDLSAAYPPYPVFSNV